MIHLTLKEAQRFLISYQGLDQFPTGTAKDLTLKTFEKLASIQYDPLNVVGRNPDLVLQSRIKNYSPDILNSLLYDERQLIDGWDKMLSIYSITDFSRFNIIRQAMGEDMTSWLKSRQASEALELTDDACDYLRLNGPCLASEMDFGSAGSGSWGHRKLSSATLDYLFHLGRVGVHSKHNTQKRYDLIENLLPKELLDNKDTFDSFDDFMIWYVHRRIQSIGLIWNKNGGAWLGQYISKKALRTKALDRLLNDGLILECQIKESNEVFYIPCEGLKLLEAIRNKKMPTKQVRFIAPLDNLLWDRDMIEYLFDFKYRWEVYTPIKKREYGYYVLPILYGHTFVGRIEFEQQRKDDPLTIKNIWWEDSIRKTKALETQFHSALNRFAKYRGTSLTEDRNLIDKAFK